MESLEQAISDSNYDKVREILDIVSGDSVLENKLMLLAQKTGTKKIEALLVNKFNWRTVYAFNELKILVIDLMSELSEDVYAAGWLDGIELELWQLINKEASGQVINLWKRRGNLFVLEDLRKLTMLTKSWGIWDDSLDEVISISIDEWNKRYCKN